MAILNSYVKLPEGKFHAKNHTICHPGLCCLVTRDSHHGL